jgi:hypothetical protein
VVFMSSSFFSNPVLHGTMATHSQYTAPNTLFFHTECQPVKESMEWLVPSSHLLVGLCHGDEVTSH